MAAASWHVRWPDPDDPACPLFRRFQGQTGTDRPDRQRSAGLSILRVICVTLIAHDVVAFVVCGWGMRPRELRGDVLGTG